jgi:RHS repeat-associated protein
MQGAGGVGGLLTISSPGSAQFACFDGNGNVSALVDTTNTTVVGQYEYGPFGEVIRANGSMARANPLRFSTKYQDDETGFLYYGYRYLCTSTAKWLSRDPKGELAAPNLYSDSKNDVVDRVDPLGLDDIFQYRVDTSVEYNVWYDQKITPDKPAGTYGSYVTRHFAAACNGGTCLKMQTAVVYGHIITRFRYGPSWANRGIFVTGGDGFPHEVVPAEHEAAHRKYAREEFDLVASVLYSRMGICVRPDCWNAWEAYFDTLRDYAALVRRIKDDRLDWDDYGDRASANDLWAIDGGLQALETELKAKRDTMAHVCHIQ